MRSVSRQTGFTLVELLIAMLIGLLITLGALTLINSLFRTYGQVDELARQQERITFTVESMIRSLRNGQNWKMDNDGDPLFCDEPGTDDVSCIHQGGQRLQLYFEEGLTEAEETLTATYELYLAGSTGAGYNLMEKLAGESDSSGAVVVDQLQENGFLVCQGGAETSHLFRVHFCLMGSACTASGNSSPSCTTPATAGDWQGWLRFHAVSRSLAIKKMLGE